MQNNPRIYYTNIVGLLSDSYTTNWPSLFRNMSLNTRFKCIIMQDIAINPGAGTDESRTLVT